MVASNRIDGTMNDATMQTPLVVSTMESLTPPSPPYTRMAVTTASLALPVPSTLHVPLESWRRFGSQLQPMMDADVKRNVHGSWIMWPFAVLNILLLIAMMVHKVALANLIYFCVAVMGFMGFFLWTTMTQHAHLERLRRACRDAQDLFPHYILECEMEWWPPTVRGWKACSGYFIYFLPVTSQSNGRVFVNELEGDRNGYLRIQLCESDRRACAPWRTTAAMTHLDSYHTLLGNTNTTQELWSRFWTQIVDKSRTFHTAFQWHKTVTTLGVALMVFNFLVDIDGWVGVWPILVCQVIVVIVLCRSSRRIFKMVHERDDLVREYAAGFAAQGWWMEYRRLYHFQSNGMWTSSSGVHYLYIFPLVQTDDTSADMA